MMWLHGSDFTIKALTTIAFSSVEKRKSNYSVYNDQKPISLYIDIIVSLRKYIISNVYLIQYSLKSSFHNMQNCHPKCGCFAIIHLIKNLYWGFCFSQSNLYQKARDHKWQKMSNEKWIVKFDTDSKCWKKMDHITNKIDNNLV